MGASITACTSLLQLPLHPISRGSFSSSIVYYGTPGNFLKQKIEPECKVFLDLLDVVWEFSPTCAYELKRLPIRRGFAFGYAHVYGAMVTRTQNTEQMNRINESSVRLV